MSGFPPLSVRERVARRPQGSQDLVERGIKLFIQWIDFLPVVVEGDSRRDGAITIELAGGLVLRLPEATPTQRAGHPPREGGEAVGCSVAANPPGSWCLLGSCSGGVAGAQPPANGWHPSGMLRRVASARSEAA